ncbi:hypothetical protein RKD34_004076 [Streptomyces sp. SAI-218]
MRQERMQPSSSWRAESQQLLSSTFSHAAVVSRETSKQRPTAPQPTTRPGFHPVCRRPTHRGAGVVHGVQVERATVRTTWTPWAASARLCLGRWLMGWKHPTHAPVRPHPRTAPPPSRSLSAPAARLVLTLGCCGPAGSDEAPSRRAPVFGSKRLLVRACTVHAGLWARAVLPEVRAWRCWDHGRNQARSGASALGGARAKSVITPGHRQVARGRGWGGAGRRHERSPEPRAARRPAVRAGGV